MLGLNTSESSRYPFSGSRPGLMHGMAQAWFVKCLIACLCLVTLTGCRGCTSNKPKNGAKSAKEEERKTRLTIKDLKLEPTAVDPSPLSMKPGHWYQARQEIKANEENESLTLSLEVGRQSLDPLPLPSGNQYVQFHRDTSIAKGQSKSTELLFYVPPLPASMDPNGTTVQPSLRLQVKQRGIGVTIAEQPVPGNATKPEQYSILVLSKDPARHTHWGGLSCVVWPSVLVDQNVKISPHRIVALGEKEMVNTLPDRSLLWTPISHIVWYDADPSLLTERQQQSILDWMYYGGQIVVSGPDSISALSNSFLSPYLPMTQLQTLTLSQELFNPFADYWSVPDGKGVKDTPILSNARQLPMLDGQLAANAQWVTRSEKLIAERQVGNGRVCMTTVSLSDDLLVRWKSYGSLVNAALLRHPARNWRAVDAMTGEMVWLHEEGREGDSALSTRFRLFSRDSKRIAMMQSQRSDATAKEGNANEDATGLAAPAISTPNADQSKSYNRFRARSIASWNDDSSIAVSASESLAAASGISVPRIDLIIKLLAGYLVVLVPLNWLVFKLMGRVEWAWIAAPFIALIGAGVVARAVQLDIGFSRSENRIACLEMVAGHPRAHQTDYAALYTSLSTQYSALFPEDSGLVLPMTVTVNANRLRRERVNYDYQFASDAKGGLVRFPVRSNSTGVLHAEEMVDLGGVIDATISHEGAIQVSLKNQTRCDVRDLWVCGLDRQGRWVEGAIGDLRVGRDRSVQLDLGRIENRWPAMWDANEVTRKPDQAQVGSDARFNISNLLETALYSIDLRPGKLVGVGWSEQSLGTLEIAPVAKQQNRVMLVFVHLDAGLENAALADKVLPTMEEIVEDNPANENPEERSGNP